MTFKELQELARRLEDKAVRDSLRGLAEDPRFAAVLKLIEQQKGAFLRDIASQRMAGHHGPLAHCAGSLFALQCLEDGIAQVWQKRPGVKAPDRLSDA